MSWGRGQTKARLTARGVAEGHDTQRICIYVILYVT